MATDPYCLNQLRQLPRKLCISIHLTWVRCYLITDILHVPQQQRKKADGKWTRHVRRKQVSVFTDEDSKVRKLIQQFSSDWHICHSQIHTVFQVCYIFYGILRNFLIQIRDVADLAKIQIRRIRILCWKSIRFVPRSQQAVLYKLKGRSKPKSYIKP